VQGKRLPCMCLMAKKKSKNPKDFWVMKAICRVSTYPVCAQILEMALLSGRGHIQGKCLPCMCLMKQNSKDLWVTKVTCRVRTYPRCIYLKKKKSKKSFR